jgi:hypothetical protein
VNKCTFLSKDISSGENCAAVSGWYKGFVIAVEFALTCTKYRYLCADGKVVILKFINFLDLCSLIILCLF